MPYHLLLYTHLIHPTVERGQDVCQVPEESSLQILSSYEKLLRFVSYDVNTPTLLSILNRPCSDLNATDDLVKFLPYFASLEHYIVQAILGIIASFK